MERQEEIDARLARFVVSRDARDLWPAVPVAAFRAAQAEVARVATAVLTGTPLPVPLQRSHGMDAQALNAAAFAGGMGPLIGYWCEVGYVAADCEVAERFATALDHGRRRAARMRQALEDVVARLANRGIDVVVVKSAHTRHAYFPDPGTRTSADIDLVLRPDDWPAVGHTLQDLRYLEAGDRWTPSDQQGSARSLDFAHADDPWSLHLHRTCDPEPSSQYTILGAVDPSACEPWHALARVVGVLPQPLLLADLALHTAAHFPAIMLARLVELVFVVQQDLAGRPDAWHAFEELVTRTGTTGFVFPALDLTERLVPGTVDPEVLKRVTAAASVPFRRAVRAATPATTLCMHPLPARRG